MNALIPLAARLAPIIIAAAALAAPAAHAQSGDCLGAGTPVSSLDMKVLLISADGTEAALPAIAATLQSLGVPYETFVARDRILSADALCGLAPGGGGAGRYQAVVLATGSLGFQSAPNVYESALSLEEWNRLWRYEAKYRVRQVSLYTYPGSWPDTFGLNLPRAAVDTGANPLPITLTPAGTQVFPYLRRETPLVVRHAYTYLAQPAAGAAVTPLLVDAAGHAIVSINDHADGRKNLTITADGAPGLMHSLSMAYGIVNWVTKGLYVGQRRVSMTAQPDDVLIANDMWDPAAASDATGRTYRVTAGDYRKLIDWQARRNASSGSGSVVLELPFNAAGSAGNLPVQELYPATQDDLTPAVRAQNAPFAWISHTYTHLNLDSPTNYSQTLAELRQNDQAAIATLRLGTYDKDALVTPEISGLNNPEALRALSDFGVRYVVSDTSKHCGHRQPTNRPCPAPNTGIYNDLQPNILMVPRYPTNLFYNVCMPTEWVSQYNHIYRAFWGRDLSYQEVLDKESEIWVRYLISHDLRPIMFHQPNLCAYDGTRSLLGDLIDMTLARYERIYNLPLQSRRLRQVGHLMAERMGFNEAVQAANPLRATLFPGAGSSSIVLSNPTAKTVVVPITGVSAANAASRETYGGQTTSKLPVGSNQTVTVTGSPAW